MNKRELWLRLKAYHFENVVPVHLWDHVSAVFGGADASTKAFCSKIARKLGWSNMFTIKAVTEYKKFVYLAVISDFVVTPSKVIDQVWHEHLLFSKAYREFCANVINYTLDHTPELIPVTDQTGAFNAQYLDTIELYKKEFNVDPPNAIWGAAKFDKEMVDAEDFKSNKKKRNDSSSDWIGYTDNAPLYSYFNGSQPGYDLQNSPEFSGFEGGNSGGAGAGDSWGDLGTSSDTSSSGDSGSGDSGGGCSGSCGGGD